MSNTVKCCVPNTLMLGYTKPKCWLSFPGPLKNYAIQDQRCPLPFSEETRMKSSILSKAPPFKKSSRASWKGILRYGPEVFANTVKQHQKREAESPRAAAEEWEQTWGKCGIKCPHFQDTATPLQALLTPLNSHIHRPKQTQESMGKIQDQDLDKRSHPRR